MPGVIFVGVWVIAIGLLAQGVVNKLSRNEWSFPAKSIISDEDQDDDSGPLRLPRFPQRALFEATDSNVENQFEQHFDAKKSISIHDERVAVFRCNSLGLRCDTDAGLLARRSLIDTGADLTCISQQLAAELGVSYPLGLGRSVQIKGVTGHSQSYKLAWVNVVVRGLSPGLTVQACVLDYEASSKLEVDILVGRDILSYLFERGYTLGSAV
mmetsp:Transcript_2990/g.6020  ORF Transcript_2990/g.6020 Transcript_2990/m.6020 type:complete len:212 (+) Transcript_2990:203-838(+)|eukprot:CAMPEP_0171610124 /NCGR_PEP_ID=MMETSP0990-20121206/9868_1 /TAXON_ID=483369 /ORGANISM="non described non described, Strain CCMP2098" /LENGTH=211 /DNA_ID=CAMNT_0012173485 /DNA_START=52 /DNA_END=687 /DNA_ORIENTATION=+